MWLYKNVLRDEIAWNVFLLMWLCKVVFYGMISKRENNWAYGTDRIPVRADARGS